MELRLGDKIRELRKRDGRTQENLAEALGVTNQAVSRWEQNFTFSDITLIPSIANYFHITIDELFGYSTDREIKIAKIKAKADCYLNHQGDMTECIAELRDGLKEFPDNPDLSVRLGYALSIQGLQKYSLKMKMENNKLEYDAEYNSDNEYFREAADIFEKFLPEITDADEKTAVITVFTNLCAWMGRDDAARKIAMSCDPMRISREIVLKSVGGNDEKSKHIGEALLELVRLICETMVLGVRYKNELRGTRSALEKMLAAVNLYEEILDDGNCGACHSYLADNYFSCAELAAEAGDIELGVSYFGKAVEHWEKYKSLISTGMFHYTAPLVCDITVDTEKFVPAADEYRKTDLSKVPNPALRQRLSEIPEYAEYFEN
ncbi:MAG: helix-turn-helix transcriptional regulator [Eubacteriales bacterium]